MVFILVAFTLQGFCQERSFLEKPKVDQRVELLSIVFRLAEASEYSSTMFKLYVDRIDKHFGVFKNHELIDFAKSIRNTNGIGYDAVMSLAIHLDENLNLLTSVTDNSLEKRWTEKNVSKFVSLLKKFYIDADFEKFYNDNADLYTEVSNRFLPVYENINLKWYQSFYGREPKGKFIIVNGLGNGPGSYGPGIHYQNGSEDIYAIIGTWNVDSAGLPVFKMENYFSTLIHEFNHSFVNYLTEKNRELFRENGEKIFATLESEMRSQAYGNWETMVNEALVRAAVIKYMKDHNFSEQNINQSIQNEVSRGFFWMKELVAELENYDKQRHLYQTLESYMPDLAESYNMYAETALEFENKKPKVVSISEFPNGDESVDATLKTITVNFNMPLSGKGYSFFFGEKGKDAFPKLEKAEYINDNKSVVMYVVLEKMKEYQFIVKGKSFTSIDGIPIKDYEVNFKTKY